MRFNGKKVLNFCANNYLGLSSHPKVIAAAKKIVDDRGYGMSSVRFICGTQDIHKELEQKIAAFLGTEDTILYAAAFDANGGVFEPHFGDQDAIISETTSPAPCCLARRRNGRSVTPDMGARMTGRSSRTPVGPEPSWIGARRGRFSEMPMIWAN